MVLVPYFTSFGTVERTVRAVVITFPVVRLVTVVVLACSWDHLSRFFLQRYCYSEHEMKNEQSEDAEENELHDRHSQLKVEVLFN